MLQESLDLMAEADALAAFLRTLEPGDWQRPTPFMDWTPWDVVAHLHYFDRVSLLALEDEAAFGEKRVELVRALGEGRTNAEIARAELGDLDPGALLERWHGECHRMAGLLGESDPRRRLPWFGPDMGVRMFTTARYMETWAHGQDVYDLMRVPRTHTDRIRNVAAIGVRTYAWTFVNRGLEVPGPAPYVRLVAPSGAIWEWNEQSDTDFVRGSAVEFCQVVTQGRNVADTALEIAGEAASRWMPIAQCFAGGPADPPAPGKRAW